MKRVVIVGCGLSGAVAAREIAETFNGVQISIVERRNHIGGNMYDYIDSHGILVHKYGPHTFHTKDKELYDYICRYGKWNDYKLICRAEINGIQTPSPFNFQTIDDFFDREKAEAIKKAFKEHYPEQEFVTVLNALNSDSELIREYAQFLFDNDYKLYTAKQWGGSSPEIDPSVLSRVPLRCSYNDGYFDDPYQAMPETSYTDFFKNVLNHPSIQVCLNYNAYDHLEIKGNSIYFDGSAVDLVVFSGAVDELFDCCYGKLPYRSLRFEWRFEDVDSFQSAPVVAYPQEEGYTRITEYKKIPVQYSKGTSYAVEYSLPYGRKGGIEPYYPVLTTKSKEMYEKYYCRAEQIKNLVCCGRLGRFRYFNMDQALKDVLEVIHGKEVYETLR